MEAFLVAAIQAAAELVQEPALRRGWTDPVLITFIVAGVAQLILVVRLMRGPDDDMQERMLRGSADEPERDDP